MDDIVDDQNNGLDSIPMPSSNSLQSSTNNEVIDSWQRAQNALYSIGSTNVGYDPSCFPRFPPFYNTVPNLYTTKNTLGKNTIPFNYGTPITPNIIPNLSVNNFYYNQNQMASSVPYTSYSPNKPVRFIISKNKPSPSNSLQVKNSLTYPPALKDYIERSYNATSEDDRPRLEKFLESRVEPLLKSGAVHAVNWSTEPLPNELNFQIHSMWTPAKDLKRHQVSSSEVFKKRNNIDFNKTSETSLQKNQPPQALPFDNANEKNLLSNDQFNVPKSKKQNKKKKKQQSITNLVVNSSKNGAWAIIDTTDKKESRAKRFSEKESVLSNNLFNGPDFFIDVEKTLDNEDIVGTCMEVEKPFFRLTSTPDPNQVRPYPVLTKALDLVKKNYSESRNYRYACDQLKSIRQDLMIQNIRNDFTVQVYESNARIALENKDREEFNQCQNQLKILYKELDSCVNKWEFTSYRLLYYIYMKDILDVSLLLDELTPENILNDDCLNFAVLVWEAWSMLNYVKLFRLYSSAPKMTSYVMDMFIERERKEFCLSIFKAYRPGIALSVVAKWLAFDEKEVSEWLSSFGINVMIGETLNCRHYANIVL